MTAPLRPMQRTPSTPSSRGFSASFCACVGAVASGNLITYGIKKVAFGPIRYN